MNFPSASTTGRLVTYETVQAMARHTLALITDFIRPGVTEAQLLAECRRLMDAQGATGYWWFGEPALVLADRRLRDSMEGDEYRPGHEPMTDTGMVTIDLAPEIDGCWGDCARSFFLKDGQLVSADDAGLEQAEGMAAEASLHQLLLEVARPEMRFQELHSLIDARVRALGFENLDFLANFGHNIGDDLHARAFIDARCAARLDSVLMFTLEPHIAKPGSPLAFKYEEIYRFESGRLRLL